MHADADGTRQATAQGGGQGGAGQGGFGRGGGAAGGRKGEAQGNRPLPVVAEEVKTGSMDVYINALGSVTALNTVTVHTRVDGQILRLAFNEGQVVRAGDL